MNLKNRSYQKEFLDEDYIPFGDIKRNMKELNFINTYLGGHAITIAGFRKLITNNKPLTICEVGCGGGDNIMALEKWCIKKNISASFIGIDMKLACIDFAKSKNSNQKISWITSDYLQVNFDEKPDIIFSSLFCHHFTNEQLLQQFKWMYENSKVGFFVNDLERNPLAYYSIKFLTSIFSSSYLVKNDAPLSVARGFKKAELNHILQSAGLKNYSIEWKWAFRYLITFKHG